MSQPPDPHDPWATPTGDEPPFRPEQGPPAPPSYGQPAPYGQPPAPGQGYGYGYPPAYGQPPRTNGKAVAALWTGIGTLLLTLCCGLGVLGVVPIVLGVKARSEIAAAGGHQEGSGMALAGIITGAAALLISLLVIAALVAAIGSSGFDFEGSTGTGI
jgi:hypothetical protein